MDPRHGDALRDRVVLITGGATGIGAVYARAFARVGSAVVVADLPSMAGEGAQLAESLQADGLGRAQFTTCDVTDEDDLATVVREAEDLGGVDVLVNNAAVYRGLGAKRKLIDLEVEDWDRVLTVNVRGSWQAMKAVVPGMRRRGGGRIINVSSAVARDGTPGFPHYVASKAAVEGLTRAAARELGADGITVNCIAPGLVRGEASDGLNDQVSLKAAVAARSIERDLVPDDLVSAVLWLASPSAGFVTGQTIIIDGGRVLV